MNGPTNSSTSANGTKVLWWIIGLLTSVLLAVGGGAVSVVKTSAERIAVLESQLMDTRQQLVLINQKLDRLLDLYRGKP
ncbi:MAG TPA: hypothetical protein VNK04_21090 [Gemmataceae bacterium]|jgi:hypothetical protein|nr:hypothetical protein [Gemmataceae bacterium]